VNLLICHGESLKVVKARVGDAPAAEAIDT
jgi:hypothetical protein